MRFLYLGLFLTAIANLTANCAQANVIAGIAPQSGQNGFRLFNFDSTTAYDVAWTQNTAYSDVSINIFGLFNGNITAYLTNSIGSGTTVANQVASNSDSFAGANTYETIFSDIPVLSPGTYYLTVIGAPVTPHGLEGGPPPFTTVFTTAPGATLLQQGSTSSAAAYAPASTFSPLAIPIDGIMDPMDVYFNVNGTPVPEPTTLLPLGLIGLVFRRRK